MDNVKGFSSCKYFSINKLIRIIIRALILNVSFIKSKSLPRPSHVVSRDITVSGEPMSMVLDDIR